MKKKKLMTSLINTLKMPAHLRDTSLQKVVVAFLMDSKKTTRLFFVLLVSAVLWILYATDSFEDPKTINHRFPTETPRPTYFTPTPIPSVLTETPTSTP